MSNLGLSAESIWSYHIGEVVRYKDSQVPELLPYGYLVGDSQNSIHVCLKGALHSCSVDALAFETLIPKSIVQRYCVFLFSVVLHITCFYKWMPENGRKINTNLLVNVDIFINTYFFLFSTCKFFGILLCIPDCDLNIAIESGIQVFVFK